MELEHVALNVADPHSMAQWYAEHLDMRIVRADDEPPHIHFLADSAGRSMIELYHQTAAEVPDYTAIDPFTLHLAFSVPDIEGVRGKLIAAGATAAGEIFTIGNAQLAFLRDPWGVPIQLVQRPQPLI